MGRIRFLELHQVQFEPGKFACLPIKRQKVFG